MSTPGNPEDEDVETGIGLPRGQSSGNNEPPSASAEASAGKTKQPQQQQQQQQQGSQGILEEKKKIASRGDNSSVDKARETSSHGSESIQEAKERIASRRRGVPPRGPKVGEGTNTNDDATSKARATAVATADSEKLQEHEEDPSRIGTGQVSFDTERHDDDDERRTSTTSRESCPGAVPMIGARVDSQHHILNPENRAVDCESFKIQSSEANLRDLQGETKSPPLIEATLVTEPVVATVDHGARSKSTVDRLVEVAIVQTRTEHNRRIRRRIAVALLAIVVVGAGATLCAVFLGAESGDDDDSSFLCRTEPLEFVQTGSCELDTIDEPERLLARGVNSDSTYRVEPEGPYSLGNHTVRLVAEDLEGNHTDSCNATIVVLDTRPKADDWTFLRNHAYRVGGCTTNWSDAEKAATAVTLCDAQGHLATITSKQERDVVRDFVKALAWGDKRLWLGGFQPEMATEPGGNWTWVSDEGLVSDGYTDWVPGSAARLPEPNDSNGDEDCMIIRGADFNFGWDDFQCHFQGFQYLVEFELQKTVMIEGCDSGVIDRLKDASTCSYLIESGLMASCSSLAKTSNDEHDGDFRTCAQDFLTQLVEKGYISLLEQEKIINCGSDNQKPRAVCQDVEISVATAAQVTSVEAYMFDNGSSDPDGDSPLRLELEPPGPFGLGSHTVTMTVADGRGGADNCQATLIIWDGNKPPVAKCQEVLEMTEDSLCSGQIMSIDGSLLDNNSSDPEGASLKFNVETGPYTVGMHTLTLKVEDDHGQLDACNTTLIVKPRDASWVVFENHAYRAQVCNMEYWDTANQSAAAVSLCGARAHLATITSVQERDAVVDMVSGLMLLGGGNKKLDELYWLGGYQPEQAVEHRDNWTWVNNEGQIFDGYRDWDSDEPNKKDEDCLAMDSDSGFRWNNKECSNKFRYIEEVDLERTVVIDGCDSGVPDVLINVEPCRYAIAEGISSCVNNSDGADAVDLCLDQHLAGFIENGNITTEQKDSIEQCVGKGNTGRRRKLLRG